MSATPNHRWDRRSSGFFRAVIGEPPEWEEITRRNDFPTIIPARFRRLLWRRKAPLSGGCHADWLLPDATVRLRALAPARIFPLRRLGPLHGAGRRRRS